ncbi:MAG: ribbon-helix-helix protein, CopG family [Bacteroidales bacterium]|nr:ribbon-helix-helix protein, CopG family [Bacteroidales bacterium]
MDPAYFDKQKESLLRSHRKSVLFNDREMSAIDEYCRRFKVRSRSALIRQAVMERVLRGLEENHPTLF